MLFLLIQKLLPTFAAVELIFANDFNSYLYTQYHCLPRTLNVNKLDSDCHSTIRRIKFEFDKIFVHHDSGIKQTSKSPHLPCDRKLVESLGDIFSTRYRINRKKIK